MRLKMTLTETNRTLNHTYIYTWSGMKRACHKLGQCFVVLIEYTLAFLFLSSRFPQASGDVGMVSLMCAPVDLINRCTVTWNTHTNGSDVVATAISYNVTYFGENITNGSVTVDDPMAVINLPAVDSDVNVFVTAMNASGSGPARNIAVEKIMSSSVIDVTATLDTPNENRILHSITVNCTIHSDSTADMCEVMATANGHNLTGTAPITNGMATVTINGLACGVTYTIIAGGTLNGVLEGPRSSHGTTKGPCPEISSTTSPNVSPTMSLTVSPTMSPTVSTRVISKCDCDSVCDHCALSIGIIVGVVCAILIVMVIINIICYICFFKKYVPARSSPHDEIPMNPNSAYEVMNPDSKDPTSPKDYEDIVV